jgi:RNA polymerase sigma-70 factor, ECF subfamily
MVSDLTIEATPAAATTLAMAAAGHADALARIVALHQDDMSRIAYVICGNVDLAQEAVQTAWLVAWRKLGSVREPERLRSWLMSVAANEARQLMRRRRRHIVVDLAEADLPSGHTERGYDPAGLDLAMALRRLSAEERTLLALRFMSGLDATEIGRVVGISPSGVRSRLSRLVARLRVELQDV